MYLDYDLFVLDNKNVTHHLSTDYDGNLFYKYEQYKLIKGIYNHENNPIIFDHEKSKFTKLETKLPNKIDKYMLCLGGDLLIVKTGDKLHLYQKESDKEIIIEDIKDVFGSFYSWYYIK